MQSSNYSSVIESASLEERQVVALERSAAAHERTAAAAEAAVTHLKAIAFETGTPQYVLTAIDKIPEVLEVYLLNIVEQLKMR
ncbi:hypothetical protein FQK07_03145 [Synechococcus sp. BSF8S]|uniref:hypothetical protein n=1 Tax=Synechococcales TaxID=1890424 RepID=UPI001625CA55|nr:MULTISPECIES: hypothetical protein [unclassified Synechococcus]MBC1260273.1 hypothetical protein [Synechococcus sp. BSF8S]MBC1262909.1 hypothetical protein [Synechococcus sp. BSA11S]